MSGICLLFHRLFSPFIPMIYDGARAWGNNVLKRKRENCESVNVNFFDVFIKKRHKPPCFHEVGLFILEMSCKNTALMGFC